MSIFVGLLGANGIVVAIGIIVFLFSYKYSVGIFDWVERQTMGTKDYILEKFEILLIEVAPTKIVYLLLVCSIGMGGLVFLSFAIFGSWAWGLIVGLVVGFIGFKIPRPFVDYLVQKRILDYQGQMVDALQLLANGIRAGLSVPQAIGMVVDELKPPVSQEFNIILQQNKIGVPLEECFENLVKRIPTEDNEMFVSSINILRETGGNLAEVFDTIIDVIRERIKLQQKIATATAQGKIQGLVLFSMPFALVAVFSVSDPEVMKELVTNPVGWVAIILALILDLTGGFLILKIIRIKV